MSISLYHGLPLVYLVRAATMSVSNTSEGRRRAATMHASSGGGKTSESCPCQSGMRRNAHPAPRRPRSRRTARYDEAGVKKLAIRDFQWSLVPQRFRCADERTDQTSIGSRQFGQPRLSRCVAAALAGGQILSVVDASHFQ